MKGGNGKEAYIEAWGLWTIDFLTIKLIFWLERIQLHVYICMYIHPLLLVCEMLLCIHNNLVLYHKQANAHIIIMWCCHSSYNIWYWCLDGPTSLSNYLDCKQRGVTGAKRGAIKWAINRDVTLGEGIKKLCHTSIRLKGRQHTDRQDAPT